MSPGNPGQAGPRVPVIRHFIACERIDRTPDGKHCSLINVVHAIRPAAGDTYPLLRPLLCFFVQMTDGQGRHSFQLEMVFLDSQLGETTIHTTPPVSLDLGQDPVAVQVWPVRLRNLPFQRPGLYEFRLFCDGKEVAREPILLR